MKGDKHLGSELLRDFADKATELAKDFGLSVEKAEELGNRMKIMLSEDWGGQMLYIPMTAGRIAQREARNVAIRREFTGDNVADLAAKYRLSVHTVYRIIKAPTN